jgi:replicative DNA helicase
VIRKNDLAAEFAAIGIVLNNPTHSDIHPTTLRPQYFADTNNRMVWDVILQTIERHQPPSVVNVHATAVINNVADMITSEVLTEYSRDNSDHPVLFDSYAKRILDAYRYRATVDVLQKSIDDLQNEEVYDTTIEALSTELYKIQTQTEESEVDRKAEVTEDVLAQIFQPSKGVVSTPFNKLNTVVGGLSDEEMVILAARPGMGKTSAAVSIMVEMARNGVGTGLFSLDMGRHQIWRRFLSYASGISVQRFKEHGTGQRPFDLLERGYIEDARKQFLDLPIHVDASSVYTITAIKNRIRHLVTSRHVRVLFIDHIGKVVGDRKFGRTEEVGIVARELKRFAKEFGVSLVVLSQLNRQVESRSLDGQHKRPRLSDLRDSGDIEQEADMVWMLYRPEYYKLNSWEDGSPCANQIEIMVEKNRDGAPETVRLRYEAYRGAVTNLP